MAKWPQTKLGQISQIYSGFAFRSQDLGDHGIPVLKIANIQNKRVSPECSDHFPEELYTGKLNRFLLHPDDTLIAMTGAGSVGKVGRMPRNPGRFLVNQRVAIVRPDSSKCDPAFVYFALSQDHYEKLLYGFGLGAGQPNISGKQIGELELPFPPLPIQQRIAGILSAYDELIENSHRRIKILESIARALYREWFVHFRFPGYESVPRVPSPLGEIPKGWEVRRIDEALSFESGRTIKKEERESGDTPVYGANGIIGGTSNSPMADKCIIMGKIGSCGALHRSHMPCWVTNNAFLVKPAAIQSWELAWLTLLEIDFRQYVGGAANPYMPINAFGQHEILVAPDDVQVGFQKRAAPLRSLVDTLSDRVDNLRRTRDLLLPRLLSGQIDVGAIAS